MPQPLLATIHICNKLKWPIHNNINSNLSVFWTVIYKTMFSPWSLLYEVVTISYMHIHRVFSCSLFASCFFQIFKDFSWDWTCRPYNTHSSQNKAALDIPQHTDTKSVTWLNSAGWAVLVVSPATCLVNQARKGGPAATPAQPRWVHVEVWKDIPEIVCSFLTWLINRDVALLSWYAHWPFLFASWCSTVQLGIHL